MSSSAFAAALSVAQDTERLRALAEYRVLDTPAEAAYDDIASLACDLCAAPIAAVSFIDRDRQFFKAEIGLGVRQTPLESSICVHAIQVPPAHQTDLFVVPDPTKDARFAGLGPTLSGQMVRFYAAAVLRSPEGHPLGTLFVADYKPRTLTEAQTRGLASLARQVLTQMELRRTVARLQKSEGEFGAAFEQVIIGVVVADLQGRVVRANDAYCRIVGRPAEELLGRDSQSYTHPDDIGPNTNKVRRIESQSLSSVAYEKRYLRPNGQVVYAQISLSAIRDERGQLAGMVGLVEDITERRQNELELASARRRLDSALIAGEVGTFVWEIPHDRVYGDPNFARLFGLQLDATGVAPLDQYLKAIHPDDRQRTAETIDHSVQTGEDYVCEYRVITDQRMRWLNARGKVERDANGIATRFPGVVVDVTERRLAQERLAETTAESDRLRRIYEVALSNTPDLVYVFDLNYRFVFANKALLQMWGKTWDESIGKTCLELGYPDWHAAMHNREIDQVVATRAPIKGEVPFSGTQGRRIYEYIFVPVIGSDESVVAVAGTTRDVTERKQTEERDRFLVRLDDSTRTLNEPYDITQISARLLGEHLGVNRCAYADVEGDQDTFNLTGDYNKGVQSIVGRYQFSAFGEEVLRLMRSNEPYIVEDTETDPRCADVVPIYRQTAIRAVICVPLMKGDRFVAAMAVHQATPRRWKDTDVDLLIHVANRCWESIERAKVARALAGSEERYRILTETVSAVIWVTDATGSLSVPNASWQTFTGQTPEQYQGWGWVNAIHPEDRGRASATWQSALASKREYESHYRLRRFDGEYRDVIARGAPVVGNDGTIKEWVGNCTDVTEQRRSAEDRERLLDSERAARSEAERASRLKDDFLATLSHELRTPLNAILGWAQVLKRAGTRSDVDFAHGMDAIERNARVQTQLIEDLLDMSRIASGKLRLNVQRLDLVDVVNAAVDAVRPSAEAKQLRIEKVLDSPSAMLLGDPSRLQQVVWNLLTNAVKFTPAAGRIQVILQRTGSHISLSVSDNGKGIKPEFLPHVFERFRQADASTTRQHGGLGLGLALVRQLAELHGGSVTVASPGEGLGATFTVRLPMPIARPSEGFDPAGAGFELGFDLAGVSVLVVDDEPDARNLAKRLLEECRADVSTAGSAAEAFDLLCRVRPDVVVSDVGMPGEDGYTFIRRVRALPPESGGRTPAAALTAFARSEDRRRALIAGFQSHVTKPVEPMELVAVVASLAGRTGNG